MARGGVHKPPYASVRGILAWASGLWTYIDGHYLGEHKHDITLLPGDRFMSVLEDFMVKDLVMLAPEEEREQRRDKVRAEIMRYNRDSTGSYEQTNDVDLSSAEYVEPNSDGYYPGFEDGLVGG